MIVMRFNCLVCVVLILMSVTAMAEDSETSMPDTDFAAQLDNDKAKSSL